MPLYRFRCECGWEDEELFRRSYDDVDTDVPAALECPECQARAPRATVNRFSHEKLIFDGIGRYEEALLTPAERQNGVRFTSSKDIEAREAERGLVRCEPGTQAWKDAWDSQRDDSSAIRERVSTEHRAGGDGESAGCDYIAKTEIQNQTGWGDLKYSKWKEQSDAAESRAHEHT